MRFLLTHPVSRGFLAWAASTAVPDETVVPTLARVSRYSGSWVARNSQCYFIIIQCKASFLVAVVGEQN